MQKLAIRPEEGTPDRSLIKRNDTDTTPLYKNSEEEKTGNLISDEFLKEEETDNLIKKMQEFSDLTEEPILAKI